MISGRSVAEKLPRVTKKGGEGEQSEKMQEGDYEGKYSQCIVYIGMKYLCVTYCL